MGGTVQPKHEPIEPANPVQGAGCESVLVTLLFDLSSPEVKMFRRCALAALAVFLLASCEMFTEAPTAPELDPSAQFDISDGAQEGGNPNFFFLPPMVKDPGPGVGFDGSASPVVKIYDCGLAVGTCPSILPDPSWEFDMTTGIQVHPLDEQYAVNWKTDEVEIGHTYRIQVYSNVARLGYADVAFPENKGQAKNLSADNTIALNDGRTLPIKFRIEDFAELTAVGCDPTSSVDIVDCDARPIMPTSQGVDRTATVDHPTGGLAAIVTIPAWPEPVYLTLLLLQDFDFPSGDIPQGNQFPHFVEVTAVDASGQPVEFPVDPNPEVPSGAELILCQADGDDHTYEEAFLRLFRVDDQGNTTLHPEEDTYVAIECPGYIPPIALMDRHGHPTGHSPFDIFVDRGKRALASLFLPQPLFAVHGGLNGRRIPQMSRWGATIVDPFPAPELSFIGSQARTGYIDYNLSVNNWEAYSDELFVQSPGLPPCGENTSASRTWVEIYRADTDVRWYGYCALNSASELQNTMWVTFGDDILPPNVYIRMWDRLLDRTVQSNSVSLNPGF
jgi:hypothetical protein